MTRLALPSGVSPFFGNRRLNAPNMSTGGMAASGVTAASSARANATVTASATPHTMGSYTQFVASTTDAVEWIELTLLAATGVNATATSTLLDVAIGAAASEVVIVPGIQVGYGLGGEHWRFPVHIPVGSRIAARCQGQVVSQTVNCAMTLGSPINGKQAPTALDVMAGASQATTSRGVDLSGGGSTLNTKTAYTQIIASTTQPYGALGLSVGGATGTAFSNGGVLIDIAVGGAGSETIVIPDVYYQLNNVEQIFCVGTPLFPVNIPLGTRIAARWAYSSSANRVDLTLHGVPRQ